MEVKKNRDVMISNIQMITLIIVTLFSAFSCKSTDVEGVINPSGQVAVNVSIEDAVFEQTLSIGNKASANKSASPAVQTRTVALNKDFDLVAELTEEAPVVAQKGAKASLQQGNKAAQTTELKSKIKYKIVVYKSTGEYVIDIDYIRGQEASASPLMLDGGQMYTFIAYSINSTSTVPSLKFSDAAKKTLASSSITATGSQDLMYFRKDMTVSGTSTNYLGVVLKHKFSQITTTIDATATGFNIRAITSAINSMHQPNATLSLSDGALTRTGTATSVAVLFPTLSTGIITGTPTLINAANTTTGSYSIKEIQLGRYIGTDIITPFSNLVITPGAKYNMKIKMVPTQGDKYYIYVSGGMYYLPVARIGRQLWMRHNTGLVEAGMTPYSPDNAGNFNQGNYFQWGSDKIVSDGLGRVNSQWNSYNNPTYDAWNSSTETAPAKTINDPCPPEFRIPTQADFTELLKNVTIRSIGNWSEGENNNSAATVLTSKQNSNIILTFNTQGFYDSNSTSYPYQATNIQKRGLYGYYWTSSLSGGNPIFYEFSKDTTPILRTYSTAEKGKVVARNLRCIAQ